MNVAQSAGNLGQLLVQEGRITPGQLQEALDEQKGTKERLGEILVRRGLIDEADLFRALSSQLGFRPFDPARDEIQRAALEVVPSEFATRYHVVPVRVHDGVLCVAMVDPLDLEARDRLDRMARDRGLGLEIIVGPADVLERVREAGYRNVDGSRHVNSLVDRVVDEVRESTAAREAASDDDAQQRAQDAGVVELVDQVITRAMQ
ncbi:MAG TPA: hypothetical protein PLQ13_12775, partial [Candidatus Krumholzibacteria bacterium]|nr:hypothetical protein [Candidatus Krumholzibacteria bacterium]